MSPSAPVSQRKASAASGSCASASATASERLFLNASIRATSSRIWVSPTSVAGAVRGSARRILGAGGGAQRGKKVDPLLLAQARARHERGGHGRVIVREKGKQIGRNVAARERAGDFLAGEEIDIVAIGDEEGEGLVHLLTRRGIAPLCEQVHQLPPLGPARGRSRRGERHYGRNSVVETHASSLKTADDRSPVRAAVRIR
jgi:hypothetical protein